MRRRLLWGGAIAVIVSVATAASGSVLPSDVGRASLSEQPTASAAPASVTPSARDEVDAVFASGREVDPRSEPLVEQVDYAPGSGAGDLGGSGDPAPAALPGGDGRSGEADQRAQGDIPALTLAAYRAAAESVRASDPTCALDWALLAGIGRVESNHGRYAGARVGVDGVSRPHIIGIPLDGRPGVARIGDTDGGAYDGDLVFDRAVGPMQFIPGTWARWAVDGDGDGRTDPHDIDDAALAAAHYLCSGSVRLDDGPGEQAALLRYNRSVAYGVRVQSLAAAYRQGVDVDQASPAMGPTAPAVGPTAPGSSPTTPGQPPPEPTPPATAPPADPAPPPAGPSPPPSDPTPPPIDPTPPPSDPTPPPVDPTDPGSPTPEPGTTPAQQFAAGLVRAIDEARSAEGVPATTVSECAATLSLELAAAAVGTGTPAPAPLADLLAACPAATRAVELVSRVENFGAGVTVPGAVVAQWVADGATAGRSALLDPGLMRRGAACAVDGEDLRCVVVLFDA